MHEASQLGASHYMQNLVAGDLQIRVLTRTGWGVQPHANLCKVRHLYHLIPWGCNGWLFMLCNNIESIIEDQANLGRGESTLGQRAASNRSCDAYLEISKCGRRS